MSLINIKNLSEFGQTALNLDTDFAELDQLCGQISRLDIESDSGLDRAQEILVKFGKCGENIAQNVQVMSRTLGELRIRAEKSAETVAERANQVHERRTARDQMLEKFRSLVERVQTIAGVLSQSTNPEGTTPSGEDKAYLLTQMLKMDAELGPFIEEARMIREEARNSSMKSLERSAESLTQSLESSRRKMAHAMRGVQTVKPLDPTLNSPVIEA